MRMAQNARPAIAPKRSRIVATTTAGLAVSMLATVPVAAASNNVADGSTPAVDVSVLAQKAREALAVNAPIMVSSEAKWFAQGVSVEVKKYDARAARRAAAEAEARRRAEQRRAENARRARERQAASRAAEREEIDIPSAGGAGTPAAASIALNYLGVPYVWGGSTPSGFDCSGLTRYVYRQIGINLPHQSGAQPGYGTRVSRSEALPGDLVWHPGHVGIYLGNGKMVHAPKPGRRVEIIPVTYRSDLRYYRMG